MRITDLLKSTAIELNTNVSSKSEAIDKLISLHTAAGHLTDSEKIKEEILKRLAKIRTESDIVDEMLVHYQERAERLLNSRFCRYWSGVLCQNPDKDKLENFPKIKYQDSPGRKAYVTNKEKLHTMIDRVLNL